MDKNFKIIVIDKPTADDLQDPSRTRRMSRFTLALFGVLGAVLAFGTLAVALLVGWVIALVLGSILILATLGAFLKTAFRRR
jgi:hypothetical protein